MPNSVLMFPEAGNLSGSDVFYLLQGTGTDRDRHVTLEKVRQFCTSQGITFKTAAVSSSGLVTLDVTSTGNVIVVVTGSSAGTLKLTGAIPAGCKVTVIYASQTGSVVLSSSTTINGYGTTALTYGDWAEFIYGATAIWYGIVHQSKANAQSALSTVNTNLTTKLNAVPLDSTTLTESLGKLHLDVFSMPAYTVEGSYRVKSDLTTDIDAATCEIVDALVVAGGTWSEGSAWYDEEGWQKSCLRTRLNEHYIRPPIGNIGSNMPGSIAVWGDDPSTIAPTVYKGNWASAISYSVGDIVQVIDTIDGVTTRWVCTTAHTSGDHSPVDDHSDWHLVSSVYQTHPRTWRSDLAYSVGDLVAIGSYAYITYYMAVAAVAAGGIAPGSSGWDRNSWHIIEEVQAISETELRMLTSGGKFQFRHRLYTGAGSQASFISKYTNSLIYILWREL